MEQIKQIIAEIERLKVEIPYHENAWSVLNKLEVFINSLPAEQQPSEELVDAARNIRDTLYLKEGKRDEYGNPYFLQDTLLKAVVAGANWQKEKMMESAIDARIINDEMMVECEQGCLVLDPLTYPIGQKLKILIIKTEQ